MNIVEKLGLYDILAMLVPGYFLIDILGRVKIFPREIPSLSLDTLDHGVKAFVACYLAGLVWHKFMELIFRPLRNDVGGLVRGRSKAYQESQFEGILRSDISTKDIRVEYYKAYYRLAKGQSLGAVPVVERQIAFLQNLIILLPLSIALDRLGCISWCLGLLVALIMMITYRFLQLKVYSMVWEADAYSAYLDEADS